VPTTATPARPGATCGAIDSARASRLRRLARIGAVAMSSTMPAVVTAAPATMSP